MQLKLEAVVQTAGLVVRIGQNENKNGNYNITSNCIVNTLNISTIENALEVNTFSTNDYNDDIIITYLFFVPIHYTNHSMDVVYLYIFM